MFKKILCATDGSAHSARALDLAVDLAQRYEARLTILHAPYLSGNIDALRHFAEVEHLAQPVQTEVERLRSRDDRVTLATGSALRDSAVSVGLLVEIGKHILDRARDHAEQKGIENLDIRLEGGDPADAILECIKAEDIDCVIMGSRGLSNLKELFLGSVSHKVANRAPCTCITVK